MSLEVLHVVASSLLPIPSWHSSLHSVTLTAARWAWQNTHLTRRIRDDQRITLRTTVTKIKKGKPRKQPAKPRISMLDTLANLHLLLRVPSFIRWPLELRFFSEDVYQTWLKRSYTATETLPDTTKIILDLKSIQENETQTGVAKKVRSRTAGIGKGGVEGVDASYVSFRRHLEKSLGILTEGTAINCTVCKAGIESSNQMALICPTAGCKGTFHMTCLSQVFLQEERSKALLPKSGRCPSCNTELKWVDLVKEMTLRLRGEKEVARLIKKSRGKQVHAITQLSQGEAEEDDHSWYEGLEELSADEVADEPLKHDALNTISDDDETSSVTSAAAKISESGSPAKPTFQLPPGMETVIEDSDWEGVEVLD